MKRLKSYSNVWNVEKVLYSINDLKLPFAMTYSQIGWFVFSLITCVVLKDVPPLSLIEGDFLRYLGVPIAVTWFMSQKTFDGKKPYKYLGTMVGYAFRCKTTYAGKPLKMKKMKVKDSITAVRSEKYVPD